MRPSCCSLLLLGVLAALGSGCGKARSGAPPDGTELAQVPCNPLQNSELAASLSQPLGVARDRTGSLYALSRVGSRSVAWSSLDDQLIAYEVFQENRALTGTIFGVRDGSDGFALTLSPETAPATIRMFQDLADAAPGGGFPSTTTKGTLLEVLPASALTGFEVATRISPAQVIGLYRTIHYIDGAVGADLLLVRSSAASTATPAVFYGTQGVLLQRRVLDSQSSADGSSVDVRFMLDGEVVELHVEGSGAAKAGSWRSSLFEDRLLRAVATPLGLSQLEFRCATPLQETWRLTEPSLPGGGCVEPVEPVIEGDSLDPGVPFFCLESSASSFEEDARRTELALAQVEAIGVGTPPPQAGACSERVIAAVHDFSRVASWARLTHEGGESWLALVSPEPAPPFQVGETLSLRAWERPGSSPNASLGELEIRVLSGTLPSSSDYLLLWMGAADDFSQLQGVPEFELSRGPESCARIDDCEDAVGSWRVSGVFSQYALDAWSITNGPTRVGYGSAADFAGLRIYNSGIQVQNGDLGCRGTPSGFVRLALWRTDGR